jgi:hypothetical protein
MYLIAKIVKSLLISTALIMLAQSVSAKVENYSCSGWSKVNTQEENNIRGKTPFFLQYGSNGVIAIQHPNDFKYLNFKSISKDTEIPNSFVGYSAVKIYGGVLYAFRRNTRLNIVQLREDRIQFSNCRRV